MSALRPLSDFGKIACEPATDIGERAELCLLPLSVLVVDDSYQRTISSGRGRAHVKAIVEAFDWRKFTPVIVAPAGDGRYAIIDGQHRATAALMHPAIDMVPCMVIKAGPEEAAACFAAINGKVTRLSSAQIHRAEVAARAPRALEVEDVCRAAGVTVVYISRDEATWRPGETTAVATLQRCLKRYGRETLFVALKAITASGDGSNAGKLITPVIRALCAALHRRSDWHGDMARLIRVMDDIDLDDWLDGAAAAARKRQVSRTDVLTDWFRARFSERIGGAVKLIAAE